MVGGPDARPVVLIADDEPALLELFQLTLEAEHTVVTAPDGETAWTLIQQHRPEVVLLDVQLPRRSGLAVASAIQAEPALAGTAVILMTGLSEADAHSAASATGARDYLTKPVRLQDLLAAVRRAVVASQA
jgi:DNA-binding response OmpR family regulator